jgi:hypothetical protein
VGEVKTGPPPLAPSTGARKKKKVAKIGNEMQREDGSGKFENSRADSHTLLPPFG